MKNALCMALLASACLLTAGNASASPFPLYDNFAAPTVDSSKWYGGESDYLTLDAVREITLGHRLHLAATAYSSPNDDGYSSGGTYGLYFIHPEGITAVSYSVQVDKATATACPTNTGAEVVAGPEFRGRFFNTQANPTSQLGDVEFAIGLDRRPSDGDGAMTASYIYQECANSDCSSRNTIAQGTLGTVPLNQRTTVIVRWDQANHRFLFNINGKKGASRYRLSDSSAPYSAEKEIDVAHVIVDCAATPRPQTTMDAYFDNIRVAR